MGRKDEVWQNRTSGYIEMIKPGGYDVLINGSDRYLNWNTISGETGYGIRDNAGTMQFKNSGGAWTSFGAGGGGAVDSVNGYIGVVVLTTGDITDSSNKRYVTDANLITIGNQSGTNTGDNAVNTLYSGLVSNATHTGDATGATALTVVAINGTNMAGLGTGILKNTTATGVPSIAIAGDFPTLNQNTTGSAATLTTTRTIWGQNFNGSANVTGTLALGASDLTLTGSIGATGARVTKLWTTDLESTNMPTVGGTAILTSLTAPQFTTIELGHATDTTLSRVSAGVIAIEGKTLVNLTDGGTFIADISVPDEAYGAGWNGSVEVPTKNAVYDKIETLSGGGANTTLSNLGTTAINAQLNLVAGTTTVAPMVLTSGTNLTTAVAGAVEYDGKVFYSTHASTERGVIPSEQFMALTSDYTLTSTTSVQKLFNATTNGEITLSGSTSYWFECSLYITSMSSTSGNAIFNFLGSGTATLTSISFSMMAIDNSAPATTTNTISGYRGIVNSPNIHMATAGTGTALTAYLKGIVRINAGGTVIPSIALITAAAAVVNTNSYIKFTPIGSNTVTNVGKWS